MSGKQRDSNYLFYVGMRASLGIRGGLTEAYWVEGSLRLATALTPSLVLNLVWLTIHDMQSFPRQGLYY